MRFCKTIVRLVHGIIAASMLSAANHLVAQTAITSINTTTTVGTPGAAANEGGIVFDNTVIQLKAFATATQAYGVTRLADSVYVRRNSTSATQSSVWYRTATSGSEPIGVDTTNYGTLLMTNNLAMGSDNTFANNTTPTQAQGNVERIDFIFTSPLSANNSIGFAVFDRGATGVHDQFKIAAITGWDGSNVTGYGTLTGPSATWGATNLSIDGVNTFDYRLFRYASNDNISTSTVNNEVGNQGIAGLMYSMADLGIAAGTPVYGYSLFGYDVNLSGSALLDVNNYSTTTDGATGGGGIDLLAVNGISFSLIPEPSTYALCGMGMMSAFAAWWNRRSRRSVVNQN